MTDENNILDHMTTYTFSKKDNENYNPEFEEKINLLRTSYENPYERLFIEPVEIPNNEQKDV